MDIIALFVGFPAPAGEADDAAVAGIGDKDVARAVDRDGIRPGELVWSFALGAPCAQERAVTVKLLHPSVALVYDVDDVGVVNGDV